MDKTPPFILIHPPVSKPCEPPAGLASIAGALRANQISCEVIDLNIEGLYYIIKKRPPVIQDTWTRRAFKNVHKHLLQLRNNSIYKHPASYINAVKDINRVLEFFSTDHSVRISLSNYHDSRLSPIKSKDLFNAMQYPEKNPFFDHWKNRLEQIFHRGSSGVGISINYLSQALCGFALTGFIRQLRPDIKIWIGGGLISSWLCRPEQLKKFYLPNITFVSGPGEPHLLNYFNAKKTFNFPIPNYDDVYQNQYLSPGFVLPYSTSRGCYWKKCAFCPECSEQSPYFPTPVERVNDHLRDLIKLYNPSIIHFLDNALSPKFFYQLIQKPPGVPWYGFSRITKHLTNMEFCKALKKSGCVMLKLGIESGDDAVLSQMKKGINISMAQKALKIVHQSGIGTYVYFLLGTPYENKKSAEKTRTFIYQNKEFIDFLNLAIFNLPIDSIEASQLKTQAFYDGDLSLYLNFEHPFALDRSTIRKFLIKKVKSNPDISPIIKRNPLFFTSNHAPFLFF
ncbi:radical SAM protein [Candidatus Magnetomorum sp. HK-1]|nr:radical SAM protein [Candidatus Magnetomorum sp. HK-1]